MSTESKVPSEAQRIAKEAFTYVTDYKWNNSRYIAGFAGGTADDIRKRRLDAFTSDLRVVYSRAMQIGMQVVQQTIREHGVVCQRQEDAERTINALEWIAKEDMPKS